MTYVSERVARSWVGVYTNGLNEDEAVRRRLEIDSDLHEHLHELGTKGILGRVLRGIPADVWWRIRTLRECAGGAERNPIMLTKPPMRGLWLALVAVHAVLSLLAGGPGDESTIAAVYMIAGLAGNAVVVAGLAVQRRRFLLGSWMIAGGLIPTLPTITGGLVLVSGLWTANLVFSTASASLDHDTISARRSQIFMRAWWLWLGVSAALFTAGFIGLALNSVVLAQWVWGPAALAALVGIWSLASRPRRVHAGSLRASLHERWWRLAAGLIAATFIGVGIDDLVRVDEQDIGSTIILSSLAAVIIAGILVRRRHQRIGSRMIGVGVLPGSAAIILFWFPPFLLFGLLSIAVMITALKDSTQHPSPIPAPPSLWNDPGMSPPPATHA